MLWISKKSLFHFYSKQNIMLTIFDAANFSILVVSNKFCKFDFANFTTVCFNLTCMIAIFLIVNLRHYLLQLFCIFDFTTGCSRNCGYFFTNQLGLLIFEKSFSTRRKNKRRLSTFKSSDRVKLFHRYN